MQDIEPFYGWEKYYIAAEDEQSPFFGREYNYQQYENTVYEYYIHPNWDEFGSDTLYCKILFADYGEGFTIIEMFGEWNDTLHNDIMFFKRDVIDQQIGNGINKFILIGENILNFHGSRDDDYYAEWFDEIEDGWIAAIKFRDFVEEEFTKYHLDYYINYGGTLDEITNWRGMKPRLLYELMNRLITRRLGN
ncbi:MAG: hypothetical protein QM669_12160 [Siphonobacter sp.]